ncbi:STAS domain-containing protein [Alteromonas lipolytica]|uniref:Anti-anti-sigma factor n=1 Tax=Alteromonas lipolytica TaxID=1856405 RepID=A0A1E8FJC6_9ALTE|nr:STAS domain-containing protein [Alteromonas lipolytica]OFI36041.1 anti-anti-sigma factor [Alteromonas lipolytica]GGF71457.1 anti-anti-sigma regulatory factor [Alteromonas lipolytica]
MSIKSEVVNESVFIIHVGERFDFSLVIDFRNSYEELDEGIKQIDIDLAATEYMDSSALGMLLNMQKSLADRQLTYRIINARPQIARILQISRFNKKFDIQ